MFPILVSRTKNLFGQQNEKFGLRMDSSSSDEPIKYAPIGLASPWLRRVWSDWFCPYTRFTPWGIGMGSGFKSQFLRCLCKFCAKLYFWALSIGHVGDNDTNCPSNPAGDERFQRFQMVHPKNSLTFCEFEADIFPNWCVSPRADRETWWMHGVPVRPVNWLYLSWVQIE